jgi:hypothetical protein
VEDKESHRERPKGSPIETMLVLVKEVARKNFEEMRVKFYEQQALTFISLILPVDGRRATQFPSSNLLKRNHSDEKNQIG